MRMSPTTKNIMAIADSIADGRLTIIQAGNKTGWGVYACGKDILVPCEKCVFVGDGTNQVRYKGMTAEDAAQEYVNNISLNHLKPGPSKAKITVTVYTWREGIDSDGDIVQWGRKTHTLKVDTRESE